MMNRFQIVTAVTWRIVVDILRRHHERYNLRILELRPGTGQTECVSILQEHGDFPGTPLCHFSSAGNLHIASPEAKVVSMKENFVEAYLKADDPAILTNQIEILLGLPEFKNAVLPDTTRAMLQFRLMAGLAERMALSRTRIEIKCGWDDGRMGQGSTIRDDLMMFSPAALEIRERISQGRSKAEASSKFWILYKTAEPGGPRNLFCVFDLGGYVYFADQPDAPWEAWGEFKKVHRRLPPILGALEDKVRRFKS
jgi:hypothetical protein